MHFIRTLNAPYFFSTHLSNCVCVCVCLGFLCVFKRLDCLHQAISVHIQQLQSDVFMTKNVISVPWSLICCLSDASHALSHASHMHSCTGGFVSMCFWSYSELSVKLLLLIISPDEPQVSVGQRGESRRD